MTSTQHPASSIRHPASIFPLALLIMLVSILTALVAHALDYHPLQKGKVEFADSPPEDAGVMRTAVTCEQVLLAERLYRDRLLDIPEVVFLDNDRVKTFALVYLPPGWDDLPATRRKAIVTLHGHCGHIGQNFGLWQELGARNGMAVIGLQWWIDSNLPPKGYTIFYENGAPSGYHLDCRLDVYPFIDALLGRYRVESAMLHGFSMAASSCLMVTYRDKLRKNRIDLGVFNAGHISASHPFRREIKRAARARPDTPPFSDENFIFFYDSDLQLNDTHEFVSEFGGNVLKVVTGNERHGAFFSPKYQELRREIVEQYDALADTAIRERRAAVTAHAGE